MSLIKKLYGDMPMAYQPFGKGMLRENYPWINSGKRSEKKLPEYKGEFEDNEGKIYSVGGWLQEDGKIALTMALIVPKQSGTNAA